MVVVILTLRRHQDGIWIRRLVQALKSQQGTNDIEVRSLEDWLSQGWIVSNDCFENIAGIVNRVSDAAPPGLFKACCALLGAAQSLHIPIMNGPTTYTLCANKWCHHVLFRQAKLSQPPTVAYWNAKTERSSQKDAGESIAQGDMLIKPNAGGFGSGIQRVSSAPETLPIFEDGITLLQHYVLPRKKKLYRIWFLQAKVQCAVERTVIDEATEFTMACSGSTCSLRPPKLEAWKVPEDVKKEIEIQLLPLLIDAHCGSVEFLYSEDGQRLYFDLNLLSSLPVNVDDPNKVWIDAYDPWLELAGAVFDVLKLS